MPKPHAPRLALLLTTSCTALYALSALRPASASKSTSSIRAMHVRPYTPRHSTWPYKPQDFARQDESSDNDFYSSPRFVTHIDDGAISRLKEYYGSVLPRRGRVLDFCSSWVSHYPPWAAEAVKGGDLVVLGAGMSAPELQENELLKGYPERQVLQDLNVDPDLEGKLGEGMLDAATCTVSIDYLTSPREVLQGIRRKTREGGMIHLAVSNRCFPTKAVGRWLRVGEDERLEMVGDYLHFSGWSNIEIVELPANEQQAQTDGRTTLQAILGFFGRDPLWVVRAENRKQDRSEL